MHVDHIGVTCIHAHRTVHIHEVIIRGEASLQQRRATGASHNFFYQITELCQPPSNLQVKKLHNDH